MANKSRQLGKFLLFLGLLFVAVNGILLDPLIKKGFISSEDTEASELRSAREAYVKIQSRIKIFKNLLDDLSLLQNTAPDEIPPEKRHLRGLVFPLSELGIRFFPKLSLAIELSLAKRELVNVERKMEHLEVILANIERQVNSSSIVDNTRLLSAQQAMPLQQVEMLRRQLWSDRANLKELSETLGLVKKKQRQ